VATNAAGPATFKHGVTRDWVTRLTVVLPNGEVLDIERGQVVADARGRIEVATAGTTIDLDIPALQWPDVPKRSAGYVCTTGMDLIDLFIGAEGTLGIVVEATLRVMRVEQARARAMVPCPDEAAALAFVERLRAASQRTWRERDPRGIDVAAIEHLDRRSIEIVREDGVDRREHLALAPGTALLLFVDLDLPAGTTREAAWAEVEGALEGEAADSPLLRFCRLAEHCGLLDAIELAMPGDAARLAQMSAVREAVPAGVNARVSRLRATLGERVHKTAADMVVPWPRFAEMLGVCREMFERRSLEYAIWGHVSDGNVHPNVLPRRVEDVEAGKAAILELGRAVIEMGGCPLAEHGVGRHPVKKALLRMLHGSAGVEAMRAIKHAIDPAGRLAPGVLF
jgi:D-lactate dehydrogenase (cytochrome)